MGMSSEVKYFEISQDVSHITRSSKYGSATFKFQTKDGKKLEFKGVKNQVEVWNFIESNIFKLRFPKRGHA